MWATAVGAVWDSCLAGVAVVWLKTLWAHNREIADTTHVSDLHALLALERFWEERLNHMSEVLDPHICRKAVPLQIQLGALCPTKGADLAVLQHHW